MSNFGNAPVKGEGQPVKFIDGVRYFVESVRKRGRPRTLMYRVVDIDEDKYVTEPLPKQEATNLCKLLNVSQ